MYRCYVDDCRLRPPPQSSQLPTQKICSCTSVVCKLPECDCRAVSLPFSCYRIFSGSGRAGVSIFLRHSSWAGQHAETIRRVLPGREKLTGTKPSVPLPSGSLAEQPADALWSTPSKQPALSPGRPELFLQSGL